MTLGGIQKLAGTGIVGTTGFQQRRPLKVKRLRDLIQFL